MRRSQVREAASVSALFLLCMALSAPALRAEGKPDLIRRIRPQATWDQVRLPELQVAILRDVATRVHERPKGTAGAGAGASLLFVGGDGAARLRAAEALAHDLAVDLYRVDLGGVVSKYIGETEKNLAVVFADADGANALLFFDEADALFGRRSEVKDSHDRYASVQTSYLLKRMKDYRGVAILDLDKDDTPGSPTLRRIRSVVHFPYPPK